VLRTAPVPQTPVPQTPAPQTPAQTPAQTFLPLLMQVPPAAQPLLRLLVLVLQDWILASPLASLKPNHRALAPASRTLNASAPI